MNIEKSKLKNFKKTEHNFFASPVFQILTKVYLRTLKRTSTIFLLASFSKKFKKYAYKSEKNLAKFFWFYALTNIKKGILTNLKAT